jgi:hypothetical protein
MINIHQVTQGFEILSYLIKFFFSSGIFNVSQLKGPDKSIYPSSMLWKPVVYQSEDRSIEQNTLMQVYSIKNQVSLDDSIDQGIFDALFIKPNVSAFNVSLGAKADGRKN